MAITFECSKLDHAYSPVGLGLLLAVVALQLLAQHPLLQVLCQLLW